MWYKNNVYKYTAFKHTCNFFGGPAFLGTPCWRKPRTSNGWIFSSWFCLEKTYNIHSRKIDLKFLENTTWGCQHYTASWTFIEKNCLIWMMLYKIYIRIKYEYIYSWLVLHTLFSQALSWVAHPFSHKSNFEPLTIQHWAKQLQHCGWPQLKARSHVPPGNVILFEFTGF